MKPVIKSCRDVACRFGVCCIQKPHRYGRKHDYVHNVEKTRARSGCPRICGIRFCDNRTQLCFDLFLNRLAVAKLKVVVQLHHAVLCPAKFYRELCRRRAAMRKTATPLVKPLCDDDRRDQKRVESPHNFFERANAPFDCFVSQSALSFVSRYLSHRSVSSIHVTILRLPLLVAVCSLPGRSGVQ